MFRPKKLYKFVYKLYVVRTTIIEAKDEYQALKKFKREMRSMFLSLPTIISMEEMHM